MQETKINFGAYPYNLVLASKAYTVFLALRLDGLLNRVQKTNIIWLQTQEEFCHRKIKVYNFNLVEDSTP